MIETASEHVYEINGRAIRGYGPYHEPHFCGNPDEPCVTKVYQREVTEWEEVNQITRGEV